MDFGWAEAIAILATGIAGGSAWVAVIANRHSAEANRGAAFANDRASEALDLQKRIDDRAREFRDVVWTGAWVPETAIDAPKFRLGNVGLTAARSVSLILSVPTQGRQLSALGAFEPGEHRDVDIESGNKGGAGAAVLAGLTPPFVVHWSSPLGHVEQASHPAVQIF